MFIITEIIIFETLTGFTLLCTVLLLALDKISFIDFEQLFLEFFLTSFCLN